MRRASSLILGPKKRNCRRASSLILGPEKEDLPESQWTKKEDLPESQFACIGDKDGGPAGGLPKTAEGPPHRANLLLVFG